MKTLHIAKNVSSELLCGRDEAGPPSGNETWCTFENLDEVGDVFLAHYQVCDSCASHPMAAMKILARAEL